MTKFGDHVKNIRKHKKPGIPKFFVVRPTTKSEKISAEEQREYWLGIGIVLFMVKHSRPDIANVTRKLSKAFDGGNPVAMCD